MALARNPSKSGGRHGRANPVLRQQGIRQLHLYLGVFFAPALLFFAATGALQVFSLHEAHGDYRPAPLIEKLGEVHKNQRFELKARRPEKPKPASAAARTQPADKPTPLKTLALKWFFLATALGLIFSTSLGLWMGLTHLRNRALAFGLLCAGALIPVLFLMI
jgi:hypothetical protein